MDFPNTFAAPATGQQRNLFGTITMHSTIGQATLCTNSGFGAGGAWPANNLAIYCMCTVQAPVTAYQMAIEVTTQSGNVDVGIYDEALNRLVSAGSTATAAAGVQVFNIADTALVPGTYYIAMCCSTTAASFTRHGIPAAASRACGVAQQAVGAVALPNPATFATFAQAFIPSVVVATYATTM